MEKRGLRGSNLHRHVFVTVKHDSLNITVSQERTGQNTTQSPRRVVTRPQKKPPKTATNIRSTALAR